MTSLPSRRSFIRVGAQMIEKDHPHYNTITFLHFFTSFFRRRKNFSFTLRVSANFDSMKIRFEAYNPLMKSSVISISQEKVFIWSTYAVRWGRECLPEE